MYSFKNDYSEGAHENILEALVSTNLEQTSGYGIDCYTEKAKTLIKEKLNNKEVDVHFLVGGTQTNLTAISAFLRAHEAAIAASTGHIFVHETGAIEATGHKVVTIEAADGKLTPTLIDKVLAIHTDEHMVKPKLVYISNSTEIGTIYCKSELVALRGYCREKDLILYMDGARLGSALVAKGQDLNLEELATYTDAFYIGGTKNGALLGEALIISRPELKEDFRYFIKQKGGLLAKGRLLGLQFMELFSEDLFFKLAEHANQMSELLAEGIEKAGYKFLSHSVTNQIFPIFPVEVVEELKKKFDFEVWERFDEEHLVIRLVCSWATKEDAVNEFIRTLQAQ